MAPFIMSGSNSNSGSFMCMWSAAHLRREAVGIKMMRHMCTVLTGETALPYADPININYICACMMQNGCQACSGEGTEEGSDDGTASLQLQQL